MEFKDSIAKYIENMPTKAKEKTQWKLTMAIKMACEPPTVTSVFSDITQEKKSRLALTVFTRFLCKCTT